MITTTAIVTTTTIAKDTPVATGVIFALSSLTWAYSVRKKKQQHYNQFLFLTVFVKHDLKYFSKLYDGERTSWQINIITITSLIMISILS